MIVYDDLEPSEKIKIYDKGITLTSNGTASTRRWSGYRTGDMLRAEAGRAPRPSVSKVRHFVESVRERYPP